MRSFIVVGYIPPLLLRICFITTIYSPATQVLRDHAALYITFPKAGPAHRATALLGSKQLAMQSVTLTVHPPPPLPRAAAPTVWTPAALAAEAHATLLRELRARLARDITERLVGLDLKRLALEARSAWDARGAGAEGARPMERKGLKGLSFRKKAAEKAAVAEAEKEEEVAQREEDEDEVEAAVRPVKRRRVVAREVEEEEEEGAGVESEDEDEADVVRALALAAALDRKRTASAEREDEGPVRKKLKALEKVAKAKPAKKGRKPARVVAVRVVPEEEEAPASRSPTPVRAPSPPLDPLALGLCEDDEDVYFARLALAGGALPPAPEPAPAAADVPAFRTHATGSARTEGFYRITHAEKAAYVAQYQARAATAGSTGAPPPAVVDAAPAQHVASSRSNRATARRRAQGLEEMNQVQRAVALSRGDAAGELSFKFNQLQTRKKHLRFARSPIHDWGLYAMERVARGEMVIEYVGEVVRAQVADKREKAYERQGIGSSYLFRIDEDLVVDATKKGNLG